MAIQVANDRHVGTDDSPGIASLLSGILKDFQDLVRQQLQLFLVEFRNDMRKTKEASLPFAIGAGLAHLGGFILAIMFALLLNAMWPDRIPLWGGFGIVGGVILLTGAVLLFWGKARFDSFNPLPDKSVEALKENVEWQTKKT